MRRIVAVTLLIFAFGAHAETRKAVVEGTGKIDAVPDIIRIAFTISSLDKTNVAKAKNEVDAVSARTVDALTKAGIDKADITSSSLSIQTAEKYDARDNPVQVGHLVKRNVDIVIRKLGLYNSVIQALVDSGISEIESVKPDVSNYDELKRQALTKAIEDARSSAEFLAQQLSARVTRVSQIGRQETQGRFSFEEIVVTAERKASGASKAVPYEFSPGTVTVSSKIYVEFEIE